MGGFPGKIERFFDSAAVVWGYPNHVDRDWERIAKSQDLGQHPDGPCAFAENGCRTSHNEFNNEFK